MVEEMAAAAVNLNLLAKRMVAAVDVFNNKTQ